jgi:hypothetical protein
VQSSISTFAERLSQSPTLDELEKLCSSPLLIEIKGAPHLVVMDSLKALSALYFLFK